MARPNPSILTLVLFAAGLLAVSGTTRSALAQVDSAVGTWTLNVGKSRYSPGPALKSQTISITAVGKGIRVSAKGVDGAGKAIGAEYTALYDGSDVPVMFNLIYDSISLKRIDASTAEVVRKKGGKVVQTARRVVSAGGTTMTITTTGVDDKGRPVENVAVYDKQ